MIYAGMDIGSRTIKVALYDAASQTLIAKEMRDQGLNQQDLARELYDGALTRMRIPRNAIAGAVATGYGRNAIDFAETAITEITCHAAGVRHLHPEARTIIDIGGEDSKVIRLNAHGKIMDFAMNDRCAAGTGRFLEIVAQRLEGDLHSVAGSAVDCSSPAVISSMCVVFAETEIIGLLAAGASKQNIMGGVQAAVASRIAGMIGRHAQAPYYFTGGVALVPGMPQALSKALGQEVLVSRHARYTGALGAAILASRQT